MQHSRYQKRVTRDRKYNANHFASKCFEFVLSRPSKFDKIVSNVEFETTNDKMRKSDDEESDEKYFWPKMEQALCPDFSYDADSKRDEKRSCFYW